MKLLILSHSCVTPVNQDLFAKLEEQTQWDLTIIAPSTWAGEYGARRLERWPSFQGNLIPVPVWNSGNVPLHVYKTFFTSTLKETRPDTIYVHHEPYAAATAQMYLANSLTLQRPIGFFTWQNIEKQYPPPFHQLERWVYRQSSFAISGSRSASSVLRSKGYKGSIDVIPAGIDPDLYDANTSVDLHDELGVARATPLLGYVGRIVKEKGLHTLLYAMGTLKDRPWHLAMIGKGPFESDLKSLAQSLDIEDRISFPGYIPHEQIPPYLSALDVTVLPSETQPNWKEQFGRIIIESMACDTPVIGSDSGEIPHLITDTGGGLVFQEGNSDRLAECVTRLLDDHALRDSLSSTGRNAVLRKYTQTHLADRLAQTLGSVHSPVETNIA